MKPLEWVESKRGNNRLLSATRGEWARCAIWRSEDNPSRWFWELGIGSKHHQTFIVDYEGSEQEAKQAAETYLRGIIRDLSGET